MRTDTWRAADPYETFMGRWSRLVADAVLAGLSPAPGLRWLDVGCGTGAVSAAILARAAPSSLHGVDPSPSFVASAAQRLGGGRATFTVGTASALPQPDNSVDHVISGLVLNFVADPVAAAREMSRVLVPGGVATAYVWDYADGMQMLRHFWDAAIAENPQAATQDEGARFPLCRPDRLQQCFADAGLTQVTVRAVQVVAVFHSFSDYWEPFLGGQGPAPGYCASLPRRALGRLRDRLESTLPTEQDGTITLNARSWSVSGHAA